MAFALFASVRTSGGCRRLPSVSVVATATASYAAHASYMHVWAIASARATIGGPFRSDRLRRTSASTAAFQSLTTVASAEVWHRKVVARVTAAINARRRIGPSGELGGTMGKDRSARPPAVVNVPQRPRRLLA